MKTLKYISFGLLSFILILLATISILGKFFESNLINDNLYRSVPFVCLWAIMAGVSLVYILRKRIQKRISSFLLHVSFLVILAGAFTTWLSGEQGTVHLRKGESTGLFILKNGKTRNFPFKIRLDGFQISYYPGTRTPQDFISQISFTDSNTNREEKSEVSMNHIARHHKYRFYQSGYDNDGLGTHLSVSHDPPGIAVSYCGYALLLLSMILFFLKKDSNFRKLINSPLLKQAAISITLWAGTVSGVQATEKPQVLPEAVAARFGDLYVLYNGRICPLQTMARDFTTKFYGKPRYKNYTAEQVFTGWMFFYSNWEKQPYIKIRGRYVRQKLGITGKYASPENFTDKENRYKLQEEIEQIRQGIDIPGKKAIIDADEKFNIIRMFYSGHILSIFPYRDSINTLKWYAANDPLPRNIENDKWVFIRKSMDYIHEMVIKKDYSEITRLLTKLKQYQEKEAGTVLPGKIRFKAEKIYNQTDVTSYLAFLFIITGFLLFIYATRQLIYRKSFHRGVILSGNALLILSLIYLSSFIALRGYVSKHLPLANGYETMQFLAWVSLTLTLILQRKFQMLLPFGLFLSGLALMVSTMGTSNPQVTQLMPVLASPLLSIHVVVIMIAYSLLAFIMLNGITGIALRFSNRDCTTQIERLHIISQIVLYPAVFLLTIGIFVGAIWGNVSWGRYWGWDPKEVWALISMLIYAFALHPKSLSCFNRPMFFHVYSVLAFFSILFTYFGVNFLLGGMHSYAG